MSEEVVRGKEVVVRFEAQLCIHSRHCVLDRPDVFVPNVQGEWIHPDRASPAELLELAHNCPSGAIRCEAADGTALESAPCINTVRIRENGPLALRAPILMQGRGGGISAHAVPMWSIDTQTPLRREPYHRQFCCQRRGCGGGVKTPRAT